MRVLLNALQAGNRSGTGRYVSELARRLPGHAKDVELRVLWPRHVPLPPASLPDFFDLAGAGNPLARVYADQALVHAHARRFAADLVHYPANIGPFWPSGRTVLTIHDLTYFRHPEWFRRNRAAYYRLATRWSVRHANMIIADSQATAADCRAFLGLAEDHTVVVPLGVGDEFYPVSPEQQAAARTWYRLPEQFILYAGTIEPRKNLARLIAAWDRIADTCPYDLVLAGRDGWKTGPIREAAAASIHAGRIHFPGFIADDDLPAIYSAARVFAWPSLFEGFGLPPLEAMACGTPIVVSNRSSLPEVVGDAGVLVDPEEVEALSSALYDTATDESLRSRLIVAGQARTRLFTWDRTAEMTLNIYREQMK